MDWTHSLDHIRSDSSLLGPLVSLLRHDVVCVHEQCCEDLAAVIFDSVRGNIDVYSYDMTVCRRPMSVWRESRVKVTYRRYPVCLSASLSSVYGPWTLELECAIH